MNTCSKDPFSSSPDSRSNQNNYFVAGLATVSCHCYKAMDEQ